MALPAEGRPLEGGSRLRYGGAHLGRGNRILPRHAHRYLSRGDHSLAIDTCCSLKLDPDVREDARRRLLSVKGHVEGIVRMLEQEEVYCVDVLKQIKAVDGALSKVGDLVLRSHLRDHVVNAGERGDSERIVAELMEVLKYR